MSYGRGILGNERAIGRIRVWQDSTGKLRAYYNADGEPVDADADGVQLWLADGSVIATGNFDMNAYALENLKGWGGSSGEAVVLADQFAGANMGAKIQAAVTALISGGKIIVPPGAHVSTDAGGGHAIQMANDITIEFLPGATLTADGDFVAFTVPNGVNRVKFVNLYIIGSNNVAHTNNIGVRFEQASDYSFLIDCYFYQLYRGVTTEWTTYPKGLTLFGCHAVDCTNAGFYVRAGYDYATTRIIACTAADSPTGFIVGGTDWVMSACYAYNCTYGFYDVGGYTSGILQGCHAYSCTYGFYLLRGNQTQRLQVIGCRAVDNSYGFYFWPFAVTTAHCDLVLVGCYAENNTTGGFYFADELARNVWAVITGCSTRCTTTQAYAFYFGRSVKKLVYTSNFIGGYSTAAEYWHPDLDLADFEISHNYEG